MRLGCGLLLFTLACADQAKAPTPPPKPAPLPSLVEASASDGGEDREAVYRVEAAPVFGAPVEAGAARLALSVGGGTLGGEAVSPEALKGKVHGAEVLLVAVDEVFLAQAAPYLAALSDAGAKVSLLHPAGEVAFPVELKDEPAFQAWIDEAKPGKVRVIQRADGFEVQTNMGKLPGADPNGPTVPLRSGQLDVAVLRRALEKLKARFDTAPDVCFVPSYGTELKALATAMTANYRADQAPVFARTCWVFPRGK